MPDARSAPPAAPPDRGRRNGAGNGADEHGSKWKVEPSSTGRGAPPAQKPPMVPQNRRGMWLGLIAGFLILNLILAFVTGGPKDRTQVPYQPFFTNQVNAGNVKEITSQEETIQGELKKEVDYTPSGSDESEKVTNFETQVPSFVTTDDLTAQLKEQDVVVNAEAPDDGRSILSTLLLGFGPTILLVVLFVWLMRRAAGGGGLGGFGRSTARRVERNDQERVTFEDVAGIDEVEHELAEVVDML
jgi:cell division protease FtsH